MTSAIKLRHTAALLVGIVLGAIALGESISADLHVPAARILAAECQGFEALATAGGKPLTCGPQGDAAPAVAVDVSAGVVATPATDAGRA